MINRTVEEKVYVDRVLSFVDIDSLSSLGRSSGNGAAGRILDAIAKRLSTANAPLEYQINHNPIIHFQMVFLILFPEKSLRYS